MIETVVKVGGGMAQSRKLAELMVRLSTISGRHRVLVVPGGGAFADAIRHYDRRFGLTADASHWMAILAMDQFGHLLASLAPNSEVVQDLPTARTILSAGCLPVLLPYNLLFRTDELPRSWEVTSDSIAAWVAAVCRAERLILLKNVDGLFDDDPERHATAKLLESVGLDNLRLCGGVDPYLGTVLKQDWVETWVISGKHPHRLAQLLDTGTARGTRVLNPVEIQPGTGPSI